jgi:hypothetical protein
LSSTCILSAMTDESFNAWTNWRSIVGCVNDDSQLARWGKYIEKFFLDMVLG